MTAVPSCAVLPVNVNSAASGGNAAKLNQWITAIAGGEWVMLSILEYFASTVRKVPVNIMRAPFLRRFLPSVIRRVPNYDHRDGLCLHFEMTAL
jgi:hypothetical protein